MHCYGASHIDSSAANFASLAENYSARPTRSHEYKIPVKLPMGVSETCSKE